MFNSSVTLDNRVLLSQIPANFNNRVVIILHGATGQADSLLSNPFNNQFINLLLTSGFGVVLPSARILFGDPPFQSRWESENSDNPDTALLNYVLDHEKQRYNRTVVRSKTIDKVFLLGGSSGALMASRMALIRLDLAGIILVNGANADQVTLDNATLKFDDNFTIPWFHCPLLNIASTIDDLLPFAHKAIYSEKLSAALISSEFYRTDGGTHNWDSWVTPYYSNMIGWLLR